ncbi:unnamed protein product [Alternaria alternata]
MSRIRKWRNTESHQSTSHEARTFCDSGRSNKRMENSRVRQPQELTPEQLSQAQALANINLMNYQQPDDDLIENMREKHTFLSSQAAQHSAPSTSPKSSTLLSSQIDESAGDLSIAQPGPSNIRPIIPQSSQSLQPLPDCEEWEHLARQDIIRKGLSLDKVWDRKTWRQKASNFQRLKLLKDDGYDIAPLLGTKGKKITADTIITALIDHIKTRKMDKVDLESDVVAQATPLSSATGEEASEPAQGDSRGNHATSTIANREHGISEERFKIAVEALLSRVVPQEVPGVERMKMERWLWVTAPLISTKRKHSHDDDYQPEWSELSPQKALHNSYNEAKANEAKAKDLIERPCTCCNHDKLMRVMTREEVREAFEEQAFDIVKRRICRDIFRDSRAARRLRRFQASASSNQYFAPSEPSRIVLQSPAFPANSPSDLDICISANAMHLIMKELKYLTYFCNEDSSMYFKDPEEVEDGESERPMLAGETGEEHFRYHIHLYTTPKLQMIVEGETMALIGLVKHLRKSELRHCRNWQYDVNQMEVIAVESVPWYLSDATRSVLKDLERLLEAGQTPGSVEVRLGPLSNPEKVRSD